MFHNSRLELKIFSDGLNVGLQTNFLATHLGKKILAAVMVISFRDP
jgi:hypothetical protein